MRFRVEEVAVQGPNAVTEVNAALPRLDADPEVDVIVVTRGGGSLEDLLPFSNEALVRAVSACRTPVVSAIGHEADTPLLDLVADVRASTPTDAAKRVVPGRRRGADRVTQLRRRNLRRRPGAARPRGGHPAGAAQPARASPTRMTMLAPREADVTALRDRARRVADRRPGPGRRQPGPHPGAGHRAVPRRDAGARLRGAAGQPTAHVVRAAGDVSVGDPCARGVAEGELTVRVTDKPGPVG